MKRITLSFAVAAVLLFVAGLTVPVMASLSRAELEELADKGVSTAVLRSLIEKHCIDFDLDDAARRALGKRVDATVLEAIASCQGSAGSMAEKAAAEAAQTAAAPPAAPPAASVPVAPAVPRSASPPPAGMVRYAIVPITVDGEVDLEITSILINQLKNREKTAQVIDPFALGMHFGDPDTFHAGASREALSAAASRAGATHMVVAKAVKYKQFQDFAVRIEIDLIDLGEGKEVWADRGRGTSGNRSWNAAKKRAVIDAVRKMPSDLAGGV